MLYVIVATHGPVAESMITSAQMVVGELERVSSVCLSEDGGIVQFKEAFERELDIVRKDVDGVLVLCDFEYGTPYNVACRYAFDAEYPTPVVVVTGANVPMLLMSADLIDEQDVHQAAETLLKQALESMLIAKPVVDEQEDDF